MSFLFRLDRSSAVRVERLASEDIVEGSEWGEREFWMVQPLVAKDIYVNHPCAASPEAAGYAELNQQLG